MILTRLCFVLGAAGLGAWTLAGCVTGSEGEVAAVADVVRALEEPLTCEPPTPVPAGCCPGAYELTTECELLDIAHPDYIGRLLGLDQNGDNWYCLLFPESGDPKFDPFFIARENAFTPPSLHCEL
jgi:hypothetical protein